MPEVAIQRVRTMPLFSRLKSFLYQRAVNKFHSTNLAKAPAGLFSSIKSVGVLFDATHASDRELILGYANDLRAKGISVSLLGYFAAKIEGVDFKFDYIDLKNLSFAYIPHGEQVRTFINAPFDVLINLDSSMQKPLNYIAAASKALFKIGPAEGDHRHYDLMVTAPDKDLNTYIQHIKSTFNKIQG